MNRTFSFGLPKAPQASTRLRLALTFLLAIASHCCGLPAVAKSASDPTTGTVRISVLSLFQPLELRLEAAPESSLTVVTDGHSHFLTTGHSPLMIRANGSGTKVRISGLTDGDVLADRLQTAAGSFLLEVPGKLRRKYNGSLTISTRAAALQDHTKALVLLAVVTMPLETAVASIVQAESPPHASLEALKAQAVATRSFLIARKSGHVGFDFCDTTHCQYLREPPPATGNAFLAADATRGVILAYHDAANGVLMSLPAMYTRSCSGHTRTLREIGVSSAGYPYYGVQCHYCSRHPQLWQTAAPQPSPNARSTKNPVSPIPQTERERLAFNRIHGWSALPSIPKLPAETPQAVNETTRTFSGVGIGHGIGLCQSGSSDMARHGSTYSEILTHYYPNTQLIMIPTD